MCLPEKIILYHNQIKLSNLAKWKQKIGYTYEKTFLYNEWKWACKFSADIKYGSMLNSKVLNSGVTEQFF